MLLLYIQIQTRFYSATYYLQHVRIFDNIYMDTYPVTSFTY